MAARSLIAFCTFPDAETARRIVESELVEAKASAACGNILPKIHSIYRWKGKSNRPMKYLRFQAERKIDMREFEEKLRSIHPYEVPEIIIVIPIRRRRCRIICDWVRRIACAEL